MLEVNEALGLDSATGTRTVAGLRSHDAVFSFDVDAIFSRCAGVNDVAAEDLDDFEGVRILRPSAGDSEEGDGYDLGKRILIYKVAFCLWYVFIIVN